MITIDFETKSYADLRKVGAWAYSEHPTTDVVCVCWAVDSGPIKSWHPGQTTDGIIPEDLKIALRTHSLEAHNVAFEKSIWENVLSRKYNWPMPEDSQWGDTMAAASYYALPAGLDKLAKVLGFGGKDAEGTRLISKYSKMHLKSAKQDIPEEDLQKFIQYCANDVLLEREVSKFLGDLPDAERTIFQLDQDINKRGIMLDRRGIAAATQIVENCSQSFTEEFQSITGVAPTQRGKVLQWFAGQGITLENLQADYLEDKLATFDWDSSNLHCRRALEIRLLINKASTKKLMAMERQCGKDGRARFQTRYHGAATGRWTGSGFQPLNLTRGFDDVDPEQLVRDIMYGDAAWLDLLYGSAISAISKASRHWLVAKPGHRLISADYVAIEAVVLACLAGETWKVEAFRRGDKIYEVMGDKIYDLPPGTVTKATHPQERQDGKTCELAFGYQGGLNAWLNFDSSGRHTDEKILEILKLWRAAHPAITSLWRKLEHAAIRAVDEGFVQQCGSLGFETVDDWLTMILPNGKRIWYWKPEIRSCPAPWHQPMKKIECAEGRCDCEPILQLTYMTQKAGQWQRVSTYGGKLTENAVQATSRELLVASMLAVEDAGYPIILSVYDEIVCEVPEGFGSREDMGAIISQKPVWASNWPITVSTWEGGRYRK